MHLSFADQGKVRHPQTRISRKQGGMKMRLSSALAAIFGIFILPKEEVCVLGSVIRQLGAFIKIYELG